MKLQQAAGGEQAKEVDLGYYPPAIPYFNGINDRINIPYSAELNPASSFTVEMWVRFQGGRGYRAVLSSVSGSANQGRRGYLFCVNLTGQWQFWAGTGKIGAPWVALTGSQATVGVWTHLAATYNLESQTASLYVNGKLSAQRTGTPFRPNSGSPMHVGAGATEQPGASSCFFHGLIAKVRIWDRALSNAELQLIAAPGTPDAAPQTISPTLPPSGGGSGAGGPAAGAGGGAPGAGGGAPGAGGTPGTAQSDTGTAQSDKGTAQSDKGTAQSDKGTAQSDKGTAQSDKGTAQSDKGTAQSDKGTAESDTGTAQSDTGTAQSDKGTAQSDTGTAQSDTGTAQSDTGTAQSDTGTAQSDTGTAQSDTGTAQSDTGTAQSDTGTAQSDTGTAQSDTGTAQSDTGTAQSDKGTAGTGTGQESQTPSPSEPSTPPVKSLQSVLVFDGKDDFVEIKDPFKNNAAFTISLWVKPSVLNDGAWHGILGKRWGELCSKPGLWVAPDRSALHYDSYPPEGQTRYSDILQNFFLALDEWVHITWVKEGTEYRFYRNGELFATKPAPETFYTAKTSYWIGRVDNFFAGGITEVSFWSVARTQEDIQKDTHRHLKGDEPGLTYYWGFNEGSGNTVHECVTRPKDGIIRGAIWQQAELPFPIPAHTPIAQAPVLAFDGKDDSVEVQDPFENNTAFSICLWVKPSILDDGAYHGILGKSGDENRKPGLWVAPHNSALHYDSYTPAGKNRYSDVLSNFFAAKDQWVHIAWVKEGGEYRFYRNGELFATKPAPKTFYSAKTSYFIGRVDNFFAGEITEVSVWSVARTQADIQNDMHRRLKGDEAGLAYYWAFNEGSGTTANDRAKNGNHGMIYGATWQQAGVPVATAEPEAANSEPAKPAGKVGKVLQPVLAFNGASDYVETGDPFDSSTTFTISLWIYAINSAAMKGIIGKGGVGEYRKPSLMLWALNRLVYESSSAPDGRNFNKKLYNFFEAQEQWVHITWMKEGTEYRIYRNGELFGTYPAPESFYSSSKTCYWIGQWAAGGANFAGYITEVNIWSVARTQAEIQKDMRRRLQGDEPGLCYYLPLDESSGTTVFDMANRPNHGKIIGASWQQSEVPIASRLAAPKVPHTVQPVLVFDGRDDYVEIQNPFENSAAFTVSLWVKPSAINDGVVCGILGKPWTQFCPLQLEMAGYDGALNFNYTESGKKDGTAAFFVNFFETKDEWVHVTWVKEGKEFRIYRNGELFATRSSAPENVYTEKGSYYIGRSAKFFGGQITGLCVWSVARTGAEIQKDVHRHLKGDEPGLAYYWPLNEGTGDTVLDKGKNANHGKISGATWQQVEVPIV